MVAPTSAEERIYSIGGMNGTEAQNFTLVMMKYLLGRFGRDAEGEICPL
jgi:hypothetical protein